MTSSSSSSSGALPEGFALTARGLSVRRGGQAILQDVDLAFRAGELVALLGPSGSGKSTLLRALSGFSPGEGRVTLGGRDIYADFEVLKTNIGFVPQDDVVHRSLTVSRALTYAARLRLPPDWPSERVDHAVRSVLTEVGLTERAGTRVRNLSGGQRKRVSVAMELLSRPPLLFMDEPTSGLDPALEGQMMRLFRALTGPARLTLVTTHVLASLDQVDLVVMLARGRVVYVGPANEIATHFEVADLTEVYRLLATDAAAAWARRWPHSTRCHAHVLARLGGTR